jgi:hypothetical protein
MMLLTGSAVVISILLPKILANRPGVLLLSYSFSLLFWGISILSMFIHTGAWFYGLSACIYVPFALAAIVHELKNSVLKILLVYLLIVNFLSVPSLINSSNILHINESHTFVKSQFDSLDNFSKILEGNRVQFIYGNYWTVYPIMLSSNNSVIAIPESFNRFKGVIRAKLEFGTESLIAVNENRVTEFIKGGSCKLVSTNHYQFGEQNWQLINCKNEAIKVLNN